MKYALLCLFMLLFSCQSKKDQQLTQKGVAQLSEMAASEAYSPEAERRTLSQDFKDYWFAGEAEITSFELEQGRYGELRKGTAVLIYVTEDFLADQQVKANEQKETNIPILKLNNTKNFITGIYPYSIMNSTFYPLETMDHAIKVSNSIQEWCGQVYAQINNRDQFYVQAHSYFEGEADQNFSLEKTSLENELWTQLRVDPNELPTGELEIVPALEYIRLKHIEIKAYTANASHSPGTYTLEYPSLSRKLSINYDTEFPFAISSWEESFPSGRAILTTRATRLESIKTPYWRQNSNADEGLRNKLGL